MKKILYVFLFVVIHSKMYSQDNPLILNVAVLPPYSTHLADYFTAGNQMVITITNPTNQTYNIFLAGSLTNLSTNENATIPHDHVPGVPPLTIDPGLRVLTGNDLAGYVNQGDINVLGITEQQIINGNIPEGDYQICLQAYDYNTLALRSQPDPMGCSNIFTVQFVQPPYLISPQCSQELPYLIVQNIVFTWAPPITFINPALLSYEFRLVDVPQGMTAIQAMQSTSIPVVSQTTMFNNFLYNALMPPLVPGRQYAWRIKVHDISGTTLFSNNGESEVCEFRYGLPLPVGSGVQATIAYPAPGAIIPFKQVPIIAKYDPVNSDYRSLSTTALVSSEQGNLDNTSTLKNWPQGPDAFMQQQLGAMPTLNQVQNTSIGKLGMELQNTPQMVSGNTYSVESQMTFGMESGEERNTIASSNFKQGFGKPVAQQPILDTVFLNTNRIPFTFKTSDTIPTLPGQMGLIPSAEIMLACMGNQSAFFKAEVKERYRIEVARDIAFDSIVSTHSGIFTLERQITPTTNEQQLKNLIYRSIQTEVYVPDTGQYYWRVHWLTSFIDSASVPYETSEIQRFKIHPLLAAADTIRGACVAGCNAPTVSNKNPSILISPQDIVAVGQFSMKVKSISYFGQMASGKGEISVPFMNTIVKVAFSDVLINEQRQLYQGTVSAEMDTDQFIPNIPGLGKLTVTNLEELMDYLKEDRYRSVFDPTIPMGLPLGLDKEIEGEKFVIAIVGMSFTAERATLAAALSFPMPFLPANASDGSEQQLGLGASDVCFHPDGIAGTGIGNLYLAEPVELSYSYSQYIHLNASEIDNSTGGVANSGTYLSWDCDGFRLLHLDGYVSFTNSVLIKVDPNGEANYGDLVHARFSFDVRRSGNWIAALDFDPFQIMGMKDWNFVVQEATLDFSDMDNPENMLFPQNYSGERSVLWNGFHLKRLHVGLPKDFKMRSQERQREQIQEITEEVGIPEGENGSPQEIEDPVLNNRIVFNVNDMLIDKMGVSGKLEAFHLLELANGVMGQWSFSIDTLRAEVVCNSLSYAGFNGVIKTPLTTCNFNYSSIISQTTDQNNLQYAFNIAPKDTMTVPIWKATMNIEPTSHIQILINQMGFQPEMVLNGNISITGEIEEIPIEFAQVRFEQLKLTNNAPYLTCHNFSFSSPQKWLAGFPVSIENIQLTSQTEEAFFHWDNEGGGPYTALKFTIKVGLMDISSINTFSGSTTLALLGRLDEGNIEELASGNFEEIVYPSLRICGIDLKSISINADLGFVEINGSATFYKEDPVYGKGFVGAITAKFIKTISVSVAGCFGEKNGMRYWYVDALAQLPEIPLSAPPVVTPISLYGFGGGAFYKMKIATGSNLPQANGISTQTADESITPGTTLSHVRLVPDASSLFGLKATVILGSTGGGQVFNADLTLTVTVTTSGGIGQIAFDGNGYFMTTVQNREFTAVRAEVDLTYSFTQCVLNGNFDVMINIPGVLRGKYDGNMVGTASLYAGPDNWQLLIGTPSNNIGIRILDLATLNAYLMAGKNLPPIGPLPEEVEYLADDLPGRSNAVLANGSGIAFGASFDMDDIDEEYLCFYAKLDAGLGFDLSLLNVGDATCDGMDTDGPIGINGWYAQGRIWGFFDGKFGIEIEWFGETKRFSIVDVDAGCLLQGGFPNPGWFKGNFHANYDILNGAISGNMNFKLQIGEKCEPPNESPVAGIKIISDLSPAQGTQNVECSTYPHAVFNIDLNKEYIMPQANENGSTTNRRFRFILDSFVLKRSDTTLVATSNVSPDGAECILKPASMFQEFQNHTVAITVRAEEKINGSWVQAKTNNNVAIKETMTRTFRSGALPDKLEDEHITYSSPLNRQCFYPYNQFENGVINLKQDIPGIFNGTPLTCYQRTYHAIIETKTGSNKQETNVTYNQTNARVSFNIPTLLPNTIYRLRVIHREERIAGCGNTGGSIATGGATMAAGSASTAQINQGNSFQNYSITNTSLFNGQVLLRNRQLQQMSLIADNEHLIYEYYFRTSMYGTIEEKLNSLVPTSMIRNYSDPNELFELNLSGPEQLETYDVSGFSYSDGLNSYKRKTFSIVDAYSSNWHTAYLMPDIYDLYNGIKNHGYSTMTINRPTQDQFIPATNIVSGSFAMPLSDAVINPAGFVSTNLIITNSQTITNNAQSTINNSVGSQMINSNLFGNNANQEITQFELETSYWARSDHNRIRTMVADMKLPTHYGPNLNGVIAAVKNKANNIMITPYKYAFNNSNYSIRFVTYNIPGCTAKASLPVATKTFLYGTILNPAIPPFGIQNGK